MSTATDLHRDETNGFEPTNLLRLYDHLACDHEHLLLELTNCIIAGLLAEDFEAIQSTYDQAYDPFIDFERQHDLHEFKEQWELGELEEDALKAAFPPCNRQELEDQVRGIIASLRGYRDAAIAAVRDRLSRTAFDAQVFSDLGPSTLGEAVRRLGADYEHLSGAVSHLVRFYRDRSPSIGGLWSRAEGLYAALRNSIEESCIGERKPAIDSDYPNFWCQLSPEQVGNMNALIRKNHGHLADVRQWLQSAVIEELAESLQDYDPDWASPGSPVILEDGQRS